MPGSSFVRCLKHKHRITCKVESNISNYTLCKHYLLRSTNMNSDQHSRGGGGGVIGRHVDKKIVDPPLPKFVTNPNIP